MQNYRLNYCAPEGVTMSFDLYTLDEALWKGCQALETGAWTKVEVLEDRKVVATLTVEDLEN